jgi:YbbR domain-containing protein
MSLRSLILDHIWLKIFSVVLAALIWLAIHSNITKLEGQHARMAVAEAPTRKFSQLPVLLLTPTAGHAPLTLDPGHIDVTVRGSAAVLGELQPVEIQVFIRLVDGRSSGVFPVEVRTPAGVTAVRVAPTQVLVKPAATR